MAWVSKENIDSKKAAIKALNKKYGVKATLSGTNDHAMRLKIASGKIDFINNYVEAVKENYSNRIESVEQQIAYVLKDNHIGVNHYHLDKHFKGEALEYLQKACDIMNEGNHDNSDSMTDYFDVGWYIDIDVGQWNKPYQLIK